MRAGAAGKFSARTRPSGMRSQSCCGWPPGGNRGIPRVQGVPSGGPTGRPAARRVGAVDARSLRALIGAWPRPYRGARSATGVLVAQLGEQQVADYVALVPSVGTVVGQRRGQQIVGGAVEVVPGAVIAPGGARVGVAERVLHVLQGRTQ